MYVEYLVDGIAILGIKYDPMIKVNLSIWCKIIISIYFRKVIVVLDLKVIQPASEVAGKLGAPQQLSDQVPVHEAMAKEMEQSGMLTLEATLMCHMCI